MIQEKWSEVVFEKLSLLSLDERKAGVTCQEDGLVASAVIRVRLVAWGRLAVSELYHRLWPPSIQLCPTR